MSKHHATIYRNLASLHESGVEVRKSLDISGSGPQRYRNALKKTADRVNLGGSISEGLSESPKVFKQNDLAIIEAAEATGTLPTALKLLAREHEVRRKLITDSIGQFAYTLMILHAAIILGSMVITLVNNTGALNFDGYFPMMLGWLAVLYIPLISIFCIIKFSPQTGPLRKLLDSAAYIIPGLHGAIVAVSLSRFSRIINLAYRSGMAEDKSIELALASTPNSVIRDMFKKCKEVVLKGRPVSEGFSSMLPRMFIEQWMVGEVAGTMESTTEKMADIYEEDAEFKIKTFANMLNKTIYMIAVTIVAYIIVSLFQKVYSLGGVV